MSHCPQCAAQAKLFSNNWEGWIMEFYRSPTHIFDPVKVLILSVSRRGNMRCKFIKSEEPDLILGDEMIIKWENAIRYFADERTRLIS